MLIDSFCPPSTPSVTVRVSLTTNFTNIKWADIAECFTLEYSCASLLYFVCRSVTLAIVGVETLSQRLTDDAR